MCCYLEVVLTINKRAINVKRFLRKVSKLKRYLLIVFFFY
jgi:hypothetical protein